MAMSYFRHPKTQNERKGDQALLHDAEGEVQKLTDEQISSVDKSLEQKEAEMLEI